MAKPLRVLSLAALVAVVAGGLTLYGQWPTAEIAPTAVLSAPRPMLSPAVAPTVSVPIPAPSVVAPRRQVSQPLVPTMADTQVDGELKTDSAGNLLLDIALRDYFDYFLSAADQAGLEAAVGALVQDASGRLPAPALSQLAVLLGDYLDYTRASLALLQQPLSASQQAAPQSQQAALQQAFSALAQLRLEHLGTAATEAFFGAEEAYGRYTLASMTLQARDDLSTQARDAALQDLRAQLPQAMRASEQRQAEAVTQQAESTRLWQAGASEQEMRSFLAMTYDPPMVERLLTEQRADRAWQQRYDAYRQEVASLTGSGLSAQDQRLESQRLRQRLFTANDQHRVETYDAIAAKQAQTDSTAEP